MLILVLVLKSKFSLILQGLGVAKYWGKQIFSLGSFPKVGQKQKTEKEREKERLNDGNNNGQLGIANATSGGARMGQFHFQVG